MANESKGRVAWSATAALVIALLGWSFTLINRLSAVEAQAAQTSARVEKVEHDSEAVRDYMQSINERLARIEGKLDRR